MKLQKKTQVKLMKLDVSNLLIYQPKVADEVVNGAAWAAYEVVNGAAYEVANGAAWAAYEVVRAGAA